MAKLALNFYKFRKENGKKLIFTFEASSMENLVRDEEVRGGKGLRMRREIVRTLRSGATY